jgi:hypothetical protein
MRKVDLPHYGLYGMHHHTGANGIFDFLRSDKAIASRATRKDSRLEYKETSGQARRDNRFERGQIRREKRLIKSDNRLINAQNGNSTLTNIASGLVSLFKKKEPNYPIEPSQYAQIDTTPKTNAAGGWIMGGALASMVLGTLYFTSKKDKPKKK